MNRYFAEFDCLCLSACRTAGIDVFWSDPECTHAIAPLLYVSRLAAGRDRRGYRWWVNEEAVVEALASLVFTIFEPEMHPIEEQIATFLSYAHCWAVWYWNVQYGICMAGNTYSFA